MNPGPKNRRRCRKPGGASRTRSGTSAYESSVRSRLAPIGTYKLRIYNIRHNHLIGPGLPSIDMAERNSRMTFIAAVHTPMMRDGSLNLDVVGDQARHLETQDISGIFVGGATGEAPSLTTKERMALAERWAAEDAFRGRIMVHIGHNCLREAGNMAEHAASLGAAGIAMYAPSFFKPPSTESLITCCAEVAKRAPEVPFYYYHLPRLTSVRFNPSSFLLRGTDSIPNLRGIKYAASRMFGLEQCVKLNEGQFEVYFGVDELLLGAMATGCRLAIGSTYNFAASRYRKMELAYRAGRLARASEHSTAIAGLGRALAEAGDIASTKACMSFFGVDLGPVRAPLSNLTKSDLRRLEQRLLALEFL